MGKVRYKPRSISVNAGLRSFESRIGNLFVSFCISASHVGFVSIRMEPVFMILSQSAAIAGMMVIDAGCTVQNVDQENLRKELTARGQVLDWV